MARYTQNDRLIAIDTPLGEDILLLQGFSGSEALSRLFCFDLMLLSENPAITFSDIVGQRVTITIRTAGEGEPRYINGFFSRFAQAGSDPRFSYYYAQVVPWLWFLTRIADCRIFQNLSVPDIIQKVFQSRGFTDFSNQLQGNFPTRDYCVQYRETDFNFVSRLMEEYGIHYFFEHEEHKHTLVMANSSSAHSACRGQSIVSWYESAGEGGLPENEDVITTWRIEQELRSGKYAVNDYNFETPGTNLLSSTESTTTVAGNHRYEIYDYPGKYDTTSQGNDLAGYRMEEEESAITTATGAGTCRTFVPGYQFTLADHYRGDMNKPYLLTEVRHTASVGDSYTSGQSNGTPSVPAYGNEFNCIPADANFRPARVTACPRVQGPQTAVVVGPAGEEIYVDNFGRVKVQFFWDREGHRDEKSSCWIRVSQP
ncbi:MAG: type VI secretion system Vgr family protein, partial [Terriglobia bacterium]